MSTEEPRICMLLGSTSHRAGGLFNSVKSLAKSLPSGSVEIVAPQDTATDEGKASWLPLKPHNPWRMAPASLGFAPGLTAVLKNLDIEIIHQHGIWQAISAQSNSWRKRTGGGVIISPRGMLDPWALKNSSMKKTVAKFLFENKNLENAMCLHALNQSEAHSMRSYGLTQPIAVIPNGIVEHSMERAQVMRPQKFGTDARKVLLFLGRLHPKKGVTELIEAFAILRAMNSPIIENWRLLIAGWNDGGFDVPLEKTIEQHGLGDDVELIGPVYDGAKDAVYLHSDAFILPSYSEGLPMSILEAWSHRLPTFITEQCNLPEAFSEHASIQIGNDAERIAEILDERLGEDLTSFGDNGYALSRKRFSWQSISEMHQLVYNWMYNGGNFPKEVSYD